MFEIGEKIFYPMHGAGVIVDIQEKEILNQVEISENERAENISIDKFIELIDIFEGRWG